jgi:UPF0755 protein
MRGLLRVTFFLILLAAVGFGAGFALWAAKTYRKPNALPEGSTIEVARGEGSAAIARHLEAAHAVPSGLLFRIAGRLTGKDRKLKTGEYLVTGLTTGEILDRIAAGGVLERKFTVPEGLTSWQIVQRLAQVELMSGDVTTIPPEGSLLPETYHYAKNEDRNAKIAQMQEEMRKAVDDLWAKRDPDLPLTSPEEAVTLASIVEKETGIAAERPRIAGVFINRLRAGMKLQTDPTVIYGITSGRIQDNGQGPLGRRLLLKDLETDSPYNTYLHTGLPPGPIANPGRAALAAVMNPEKHDYLFFVADGKGGHVFSATLGEQNRNAAEFHKLRNNAAKAGKEEAAPPVEEPRSIKP